MARMVPARGGVAVRQRAADADPLLGHGNAALQQGAKSSTRVVGQSERLARVRFLTRPFSRRSGATGCGR